MKELRLFTDKTLLKYINKYWKENFKNQIIQRIEINEENYIYNKKKLQLILEKIEKL